MKTFISIICLAISSLTFAQNFSNPTTMNDSRTMDAFTKLTNRVTKKAVSSSVQGSPYFNEKFAIASVDYFGKAVEGETFLRYNAFNDEIEMGNYPEQVTTEDILLKNNKIVSSFAGEKYFYLPFKTKEGGTKLGYLVVLVENENYSLYLRRSKVYMEATVARTSLERSFPARFVENVDFYFNYKGDTPQPLKTSKKGILDAFNQHADEIKNFLKQKKIKLKDQSNLEQLFNSVNSSI